MVLDLEWVGRRSLLVLGFLKEMDNQCKLGADWLDVLTILSNDCELIRDHDDIIQCLRIQFACFAMLCILIFKSFVHSFILVFSFLVSFFRLPTFVALFSSTWICAFTVFWFCNFQKLQWWSKFSRLIFCVVYCLALIRMCFSTFYHFSFALVDFCRQSDLMGPFRKTHENCHKRYDRTPERSGNAKHRSQQFLLYESPPAETRLTVYRRLSVFRTELYPKMDSNSNLNVWTTL